MDRRRAPHPTTAFALVALALVASACGGGAAPSGECAAARDCPAPASACLVAACVSGQCGTAPVAAGTAVPGGAPGDCRRTVCDGAGGTVAQPDDADVPVDGNACTLDRCTGGAASNPAADAGTLCAQDGGSRCDGAGLCVQCLAASDCPGSDTECSTRTCTAGVCGATPAPFGTVLAAQTPGDCRQAVCDGLGGTTAIPLDGDVATDGNACTEDRCSGGVASHPPVAAGTACGAPGGGLVCDGAGACVACLTAATCPGQDGPCQHRTCNGGACGIAYEANGFVIAGQTPGDCSSNICDGSGDVVTVPAADDVRADGNACTQDVCIGMTASNPPQPAGTPCAQDGGAVCDGAGACVACNDGTQCASHVCSGHVCQAPTCTDGAQNGEETAIDCGGAVCPKCAPPLACRVDADCTTGICRGTPLTCQNPSCYDNVKNGDETDVDCGGSCARNCSRGQACGGDADCTSAHCDAGTCAGPLVMGTLPRDGATDVTPATAITVSFGFPVTSDSVTVQAASGPCTGSIQLSADGFATCLAISAKLQASGGNAVAIQPAAPLAAGTPYRVRTTSALTNVALGAFTPFAMATGFTVAGGGACGGKLVVSQVYPGGGLVNAAYANDYVELHNNGPVPVSLDGLSLQYAFANTSTWTVTPLAGVIPAGGYHLVQMTGGSTGAPLPTPDATGTAALSPSGGVVALVATSLAPPSFTSCPTFGVLDLVGWGASTSSGTTTPTSCREGSAPAPAPKDNGAAVVRLGSGCGDGNGSSYDFVSALAVPRNAASPRVACGCNGTPVNGTGFTVEMDACNVQSPASLTAAAGAIAGPVYGRVFELTITDVAGPPAPLTSQLGYGPAGTDPRYAAGWTFVPASWNAQFGNDDEFQASFAAPAPGSYAYAYRFSPDGQRWTYCDPNGAGSGAGLVFEPNALPTLTVTP